MAYIPDPIELMQVRMDRLEMAYVDEHTCICCPDCAWNQSTWDHLQATLGAPDGSVKLHAPVEPLFDSPGAYL